MTTPSFFDDLAKKCAKTKFDVENLRREERDSFKRLLTQQWEKMKPILAEKAVKDGHESITASFGIGLLNFKAYQPTIYDFRDHLPDELAQATKCKNGEKGHVLEIDSGYKKECPVYGCTVIFGQTVATHLKEWRTKRQEEESDAPAAKKPKQEPKLEPKVKEEPA